MDDMIILVPVTIIVKCSDSLPTVLLSQQMNLPASSRRTFSRLSRPPPSSVARGHRDVFSIGTSWSWCSRNHLIGE